MINGTNGTKDSYLKFMADTLVSYLADDSQQMTEQRSHINNLMLVSIVYLIGMLIAEANVLYIVIVISINVLILYLVNVRNMEYRCIGFAKDIENTLSYEQKDLFIDSIDALTEAHESNQEQLISFKKIKLVLQIFLFVELVITLVVYFA